VVERILIGRSKRHGETKGGAWGPSRLAAGGLFGALGEVNKEPAFVSDLPAVTGGAGKSETRLCH
jgi:hypothetical protein